MFIKPLSSGRKGAFTGAKAIALMLIVAGILLMAFIVIQGAGIYKRGKAAEQHQGLASIKCVGFLYSIKNIQATASTLEFEFRNEISSTEDVHNVTVEAESQASETVAVYVPVGFSESVSVPIAVQKNFTVYPDNCRIYPARCAVGGGCAY